MTLVMTSLPFTRGFQCLFTFALVSTSRWLAEIWQLCRRGVTGELEFKFQRRSCDSLCGSNLVPRVLSYPPYGAREGRREPWERGWHGRRLKEKGKLPWELARRLNLVTLVQHKSDENHCCITPLGEMTNQLHFTRPKCRWDTLNKTWWKG